MTTDSDALLEQHVRTTIDVSDGAIHTSETSYDDKSSLVFTHIAKNQREQDIKDDLIQRATTRLRRRLLEESLLDVLKDVAGLHEQLETLRVETAATISVVHTIEDDNHCDISAHSRKLDTLERQLQGHLTQLDLFKPNAATPEKQQKQQQKQQRSGLDAVASSFSSTLSMSRLSSLSLMSSVFSRSSTRTSVSSQTESVYDYASSDDDDVCTITTHGSDPVMSSAEEQQRRHRRRRRIRQYRQRYQKHVSGEDPAYAELVLSDSWPPMESLQSRKSKEQDDDNDLETTGLCDWNADRYGHIARHTTDYRDLLPSQLPMPSLGNNVWNKHDQVTYEDSLDSMSVCSSSSSLSQPIAPPIFSQLRAQRRLMPKQTGLDGYQDTYETDYDMEESATEERYEPWASKADSICSVDEIWTRNDSGAPWSKAPARSERNVLDDALSFLNGFSENGEDNDFCEDVYLLLDNPELCCRPLSEVRETMAELRQQQQVSNPMSLYIIDSLSTLPLSMLFAGLKWCKFLSVLAATLMISLLNGPDDILTAH